jgi:hypothetical protein
MMAEVLPRDEWLTRELVRTGKCIATRWMEDTNGDEPLELYIEEKYDSYVDDQLGSFMEKYVWGSP